MSKARFGLKWNQWMPGPTLRSLEQIKHIRRDDYGGAKGAFAEPQCLMLSYYRICMGIMLCSRNPLFIKNPAVFYAIWIKLI